MKNSKSWTKTSSYKKNKKKLTKKKNISYGKKNKKRKKRKLVTPTSNTKIDFHVLNNLKMIDNFSNMKK